MTLRTMLAQRAHLAIAGAAAAIMVFTACSSSSDSDSSSINPVMTTNLDAGGSTTDVTLEAGTDASGVSGTEGDDPGATPVAPVPQPPNQPAYQSLLLEMQRIQKVAKHTKYTHTTSVNESTDTFDFDCSGFVNYALERVVPDAEKTLAEKTSMRPVAEDYVTLIAKDAPLGRWHRVTAVTDLVPGDIVAWLQPKDVKSSNTGHVMVAVKPAVKSTTASEYLVAVIDSTETGHGDIDPRGTKGQTGVGTGTIVLRVDSQLAPIGYRWSNDSDSVSETTTVALGHLY